MATEQRVSQRLRDLKRRLKQENPILENVVDSFRELDWISRRLGFFNREDSHANRTSWWPLISVLGVYSSGKSSFINHFLGYPLQATGSQAVDDKFTVICFTEERRVRVLPGLALDADPRFPFFRVSRAIDDVAQGEGQRIDAYLQLKTCSSEKLRGKILIDSPGFDTDAQPLAHGTAWLAPLPPPAIAKSLPRTVSPGRVRLSGESLGDTWPHPALGEGAQSLVPFHKLSQWLTYSLLYPLEQAGLRIIELSALTGLAEYRNGGLFVDSGVLVPKHAGVLGQIHEVSSQVVVEWRALTVALLDELLPLVQKELGVELSLPAMLEGGSWAAGRELAQSRRADGGSPIRVRSDGTVF